MTLLIFTPLGVGVIYIRYVYLCNHKNLENVKTKIVKLLIIWKLSGICFCPRGYGRFTLFHAVALSLEIPVTFANGIPGLTSTLAWPAA